ncbi:response regulator transcription factor [Actinoplanes hulinensis]|uniref:response regulator transcription factor n=1 Tax=Actinoplanes hulinensis TaxID=1144547 RepID=UPI001FE6EA55|nr:hypothetical protein [Actinoplanes hulinensis]
MPQPSFDGPAIAAAAGGAVRQGFVPGGAGGGLGLEATAEIAAALVIGQETYVSRILTKFGLRDRVQAVVYAYRRGLGRVSKSVVVGGEDHARR